jgi:hypothetical protein
VIGRLREWLGDPSHQLGILAMLTIAAAGHLALVRWTPPGYSQRAEELAFALFLVLSSLSIGRGRGWATTAAWIGASAVLAGMLGVVLVTVVP